MKQIEITILNEFGLHARPASLLAKLSEEYECDIRFVKNGEELKASIMNLLLLAAPQGSKLLFIVEGKDENEAVEALKDLIEVRHFDEK